MTILNDHISEPDENVPGIERHVHVDGERGAESLSVASLKFLPEGRVRTHIHHETEEAMVVLEGELEAVLGDEVVKVVPGQTVHAPAGVKHGFVNRSGAPARIMAIFPTTEVDREWLD